jgi:hypothetical protein
MHRQSNSELPHREFLEQNGYFIEEIDVIEAVEVVDEPSSKLSISDLRNRGCIDGTKKDAVDSDIRILVEHVLVLLNDENQYLPLIVKVPNELSDLIGNNYTRYLEEEVTSHLYKTIDGTNNTNLACYYSYISKSLTIRITTEDKKQEEAELDSDCSYSRFVSCLLSILK